MQLVIPFDVSGDYTYDSDDIIISGGEASLKLQQNDIDFEEDFEDDIGFIYDSDLAEFSAGKSQQIDKRPSNAVFYASYTNGKDGSWGNGTLTGTLGGSASVHDGYLDSLDGYEEFPIDNFSDVINSGCIKARISFNYTGNAPSIQYIFQTSSNTLSRVYLAHNTNLIQCYITDTSGTIIYNMTFAWTPTQDVIYNFAINWTSTHGYIFINGQLQDSDTGSLSTAAPSLFRIGGGANTAFKIYDIVVFNTLQNSSNYTPSWSNFYETAYLGSSLVLPEMEHIGDGSIKLFNSLTSVYAGSPRILLEIGRSGNKLYWNGSAWVTSDETYTQATDPVTFNTNCPTLPINGEKYGQFTIVFPNSNIISSYSDLIANLNVDIGYLTTNPTIEPNATFRTDELISFFESSIKLGSDQIKWIIKIEGVWYWLNSGVLEASNETYSQSNTIEELNSYIDDIISASSSCKIRLFLHSEDGTTTPVLDSIIINFSYGGEDPETLGYCTVWGYIYDSEGMKDTRTITIQLNKEKSQYKNEAIVRRKSITIIPDVNKYWEANLIENENMEMGTGYIFDFGNGEIDEVVVPNEIQKNYNDLEELS